MPGAPVPIGGLRRRVDTLERELADLRRRFGALRDKPARLGSPWNLYLAKTIAVSSYPSSPANVFGIQFLTPSFTRTEGNQTPTYATHSSGAYDVALSLIGHLPVGTMVFVHRARNGQYVIVSSVGAESLKRLCRFTLNAALATSESSKAATITNQYGPGIDHSSTSITVNNLLTHTAGTYLFEGDSGDAGLAYYDSGSNWRILQMECP